jgi:hypothetical protein
LKLAYFLSEEDIVLDDNVFVKSENSMGCEKPVSVDDESVTHSVDDYFPDDKFVAALDFIFEAIPSQNKAIENFGGVFTENLVATLLTASSLRVFARRAAYNTGYLTMFGVSIGSESLVGTPQQRIENATKKLTTDLKEKGWDMKLDEIASAIAHSYMQTFISDVHGRRAVRQILNQCALLAWSSFEVLASDIFVYLLNANPSLAGKLLKDEVTRKYYKEKELTEALEEYNYDLSHHMGDALIGQKRLDDLGAIKNIYGVLLGKSDVLRNAFNEADLWRLYKTRNLIVHRAGVIDSVFQRDTGDARPVGTKLKVSPSELKVFVTLVGKAGVELIGAATDSLKPQSADTQMDLPSLSS